jgi:phospholipid/cholesterol/gamma-HCH transport system substrate-binding protein
MRRLILPLCVALALVTVLGVRLLTAQDETVTIKAHFAGVPGLYEGNNVAVLGVAVGKVEAIEPRGADVVVTLSVPADLKIPANASAVIVPASLVTDRFVELRPAYKTGPVLQDGAVIPAARTATPVEFDDLVRAVSGMADDLSKLERGTGAIDKFLSAGARNAKGNGAALREAIAGASTAMSIFSRNKQNTTELVRSLAKVTELLAASDNTIRSFGKTVMDTTTFMSQESNSLNVALDTTLDLVFQVEAFVRTHKSQLKKSMEDLDVTAKTIASRSKELGEAVDTLPLMMQNLARAYDPKHRALRAHAELFEGVLTATEATAICKVATKLPACSAVGGVLSLGADLGLTELLLGTIGGAIR